MAHENGSSTKATALAHARRGFAVFPVHYIKSDGSCSCGKPDCGDAGKHPMTEHGFKDASSDPAAVERLFRGPRSSANIGLATGPASGVWILDEDGPAAAAVVAQLEQQHAPLPTTVSAITGREDGKHRYFVYPTGVEITSRNKITLPGIGKTDIDIRGIGGYAILPPSNHKSGRRYRWEHSPDDTPLVEAPSWLLALISGKAAEHIVTTQAAGSHTFSVAAPVEDLATAPGAIGPSGTEPGQRHATALRLIGSAIGRGDDPVRVAQQAIEWGRRCSPPMADDEVLRIVGDLSRKQGTRVETVIEEQVETVPLPEPAPWPILDGDALHGLAGEIVRTIEPETEADPVAILAQLLTSFGNLIGRQAHYIVEGTRHHANLFAVLVGSTARGRKGTSEGRVKQTLREVDEGWTLQNVKTGLVSGEGLIWHVRDPIWKVENIKDKGRIVGTEQVLADPGIDDKRLLVVEPEFAAVLRVCRREQNTLSATLRSAWDSGILRTLAKNSPATATDAHVSIVGHITSEELRRALAEVDGFNGFANRFLWLAVRRSKLLPDGGRDLDLNLLAQRLALAAEQARSVERMRRDQGAAALWRQVYGELADDQAGGLLGAVTSRAEAQVLRLSMIYALLDGTGTISDQHLRAALAVWRYCRSSARLIFGDASGDPVEEQVLAAIRQAPGISRWELHSTICKHKPAAVLVQILAKFRDAGKIETKTVTTGGRSKETWIPVQRREESESREERVSDPGLTSHISLISQRHAVKPGMEVVEI